MWTGIALALLSCLPFLVANKPQQGDWPSHLARYHVMLERDGNAFLEKYYGFEWIWTGNLGVDMLMVPLGRLMGVEPAAWLIYFLLPPLTGLAILSVEWALRGRIGVGSLLAMTFIWSPSMLMGFANYSLAVALALFAFAAWVKLEGKRWRAPLFIALGWIVWLSHSAGWGALGVMVFGYEWHRQKSWRSFLAPWPLFFPFLAMVGAPGIEGSFNYGGDALTYKLAIWLKALSDQSMYLDMLSLLLVVMLIGFAVHAGKLDGRIGWAALLIAVLTIAVPRHLGGGDYADRRLIPIALMLGCLAINRRATGYLLILAPLLFLGRLGVTTATWHKESAQLDRALVALEHIPEGARVAGAWSYFVGRWGPDAFAHAPSYSTIYRDALVNTHFALEGVHMLTIRGTDAPFSDPTQRVHTDLGEAVDLSDFAPAKEADYLWYFGDEPVSALPPGAKVLHRSDKSLLAKLDSAPPADAKPALAKPAGER
ncbi:MAG: hypothetical protein R3D52_15420 [Xanthobacteraceae bacterium]